MRHLTHKQRLFAQGIADGLDNSKAYRAAYNCATASSITIAKEACELRKHPAVAAYLADLQAKQDRARQLTRDRKREILNTIAENPKAKPNERTKAIEVDNVMTGDNAPQQVQVFGLSELLALVRKGSK
jgi:hypothetical protein